MNTVHTVSGNMDGDPDNKRPSTSNGRKYFNPAFVKTPLGILQIIATVINVICIGIMGDVITSRIPDQKYWMVSGYSYMTFFVMLAFMCLIITSLIVLTSLTSRTATLLSKTTFFVAYHVLAATFYLCTSIAVLSEASKTIEIYLWRYGTTFSQAESYAVRGQVLAAGSFGIFATVVYTVLSIFAVYHYLRS